MLGCSAAPRANMRILHFSDIHVSIPWREVPWRKWFGKRALAVVNLLAGRARRFAAARAKVEALASFCREQHVDLVLFTGDYTALGLEREFAAARVAVRPLMRARGGFVSIPGNHDLYLPDTLRERSFERHFGDTLTSDLPEYGAAGGWPVVRLAGDTVAVIALNSARPNPAPWRSSGRLPAEQLAALERLLADPRVASRFTLILNHYPPRLADGRRDRRLHRMENDDELLAACAGLSRGALLCGHVHRRYALRAPGGAPWIFCSGSATMAAREGLWVFDVGDGAVRAIPGRWDATRYVLEPTAAFEVC